MRITVLDVAILLVFFSMCRAADRMYQGSNDWRKTFGYNYDFQGKNEEIHVLCLGKSLSEQEIEQLLLLPEGEIEKDDCTEEAASMQRKNNICNLTGENQDLKSSYELLRQAGKRYQLEVVYLHLEKQTEPEAAELDYIQQIKGYCEKRGIVLEYL